VPIAALSISMRTPFKSLLRVIAALLLGLTGTVWSNIKSYMMTITFMVPGLLCWIKPTGFLGESNKLAINLDSPSSSHCLLIQTKMRVMVGRQNIMCHVLAFKSEMRILVTNTPQNLRNSYGITSVTMMIWQSLKSINASSKHFNLKMLALDMNNNTKQGIVPPWQLWVREDSMQMYSFPAWSYCWRFWSFWLEIDLLN